MNEFFAEELASMITEAMGTRKVEVVATGEVLSHEAVELARIYERANPKQCNAFDALADSFR